MSPVNGAGGSLVGVEALTSLCVTPGASYQSLALVISPLVG